MFLIKEDFLDRLLANSLKIDRNMITLSREDTKIDTELNKALLETVNTHLINPLKDLDYTSPLEHILALVDLYIEEYIRRSQKIIERWIDEYYWTGATCAYEALSAEIKKKNMDYTPIIVERPEKLYPLMSMLQRNLEDYGLVLRGRLRSTIEVKYWRREAYGNSKQ